MPKLDNYLRMYRKRAGLSQDELAYLLGVKTGTVASRYERFRRTPTLETALVCAVIYDVPVKELFAGVTDKAKKTVTHRARVLKNRLEKDGRRSEQLLRILGEAASEEETKLAA